MEAKNFQLQVVKERFPSDEGEIGRLYYHDMEFRALCEDYYLCVFYLGKFRKESSAKNDAVEEYEQMMRDLEAELLEWLKKYK